MKQTSLKEVSPLLQRIINWSSIIGALGTLAFCIWAYFSGILQSKETLSAFILQAGIFGPPLFIFLQILQTVVPIIPGALTSVAGVFIYGHIIGPSTITSHRDWLCHYFPPSRECTGLSSSNLWSVRRPTTSTLAGSMKQAVRSLLYLHDDLAG